MFELPKYTPVEDNTGALLLKAAEQAQEQQQQLTAMVQKNEQIRQEAFGGLQKQFMDIASAQNLPAEVQRKILQDGLSELTALYKDRSNVKSTDLGAKAVESLVKAKSTASAYQNYIATGEKLIQDAKEKGFDEINLKTALSKSMFDEEQVQTPYGVQTVRKPKDPLTLGDATNFVVSELENNGHRYLDRSKSSKAWRDYVGALKPGELKISNTKDLTGDMTLKVSYTEASLPFTRTEVIKVDGQDAKKNVIDTYVDNDLSAKLGAPTQVLTDKAFSTFINHPDPVIRAETLGKGRDYINDHNRRLGINPEAITKENVDVLIQQNPQMINPFDAKNQVIFSNLAVTKELTPQFGQFGEISVTKDRARERSSGSGDGGYDPTMYDKRGNLRTEIKFPSAFGQAIYGDADIMKLSDEATFMFEGKPITGKRVGDRLPSQIVKDNGKKATMIKRPTEPDAVYLVELDDDNNLSDNVTKMTVKEAEEFGARISTNYGSDPKTFLRVLPKAKQTIVPMTKNEVLNAEKDVQKAARVQAEKEEGEALLVNVTALKNLGRGKSQTFKTPARVNLNGKEVAIKKIDRANTSWYQDAPVTVTLSDNSTVPFANIDDFIKKLQESNQ